jgi:hypothetical protein
VFQSSDVALLSEITPHLFILSRDPAEAQFSERHVMVADIGVNAPLGPLLLCFFVLHQISVAVGCEDEVESKDAIAAALSTASQLSACAVQLVWRRRLLHNTPDGQADGERVGFIRRAVLDLQQILMRHFHSAKYHFGASIPQSVLSCPAVQLIRTAGVMFEQVWHDCYNTYLSAYSDRDMLCREAIQFPCAPELIFVTAMDGLELLHASAVWPYDESNSYSLFHAAISQLSKVGECDSPLEKMQFVESAFLEAAKAYQTLKSLDQGEPAGHTNNVFLGADVFWPLCFFLLTQVRLPNMYSDATMLQDFVLEEDGFFYLFASHQARCVIACESDCRCNYVVCVPGTW